MEIRTETAWHGGLTETLENFLLMFSGQDGSINPSTADSSRTAEGVGPQSCVNELTLINYLKNRDTQRHSTVFERSGAEPRDRSLDQSELHTSA